MSEIEEDEPDYKLTASDEEEDFAPDVDGEKWVLFNNGSESTAWLQVLYGLGFADYLDYNKHDFYFVQYQRVDGGAPKFVLFGVKRDKDVVYNISPQIDKVEEVDVTSTLLQSLQRSEYFMLNLSDEAQICINVLLSAFNMRPNDMHKGTNTLILKLQDNVRNYITDCFFNKIQTEKVCKIDDSSEYKSNHFEESSDDDTRENLKDYVRVNIGVESLCKRMESLAISDEKAKEYVENAELTRVNSELSAAQTRNTQLQSDLDEKNAEIKRLNNENADVVAKTAKIGELEANKLELEDQIRTLVSEKTALRSNHDILKTENDSLKLEIAKRTGGKDAGGAGGKGDTAGADLTADTDPVKGAGGKKDTTDAGPAGGAASDTADDSGAVGGDAKETDTLKQVVLAASKAPSTTKNTEIIKTLRKVLIDSSTPDAISKIVNQEMDKLHTDIEKAGLTNEQKEADKKMISPEKIFDLPLNTVTALLYFQLSRLKHYKDVIGNEATRLLQNLKISDKNDPDKNNFTIVIAMGDDSKSQETLKILRTVSAFIQTYVFTGQTNTSKPFIKGMIDRDIFKEKSETASRTSNIIKQLFGFDFYSVKDDKEKQAELFDILFPTVASTAKTRLNTVSQSRSTWNPGKRSPRLPTQDQETGLYTSQSKYTPSPAYETASSYKCEQIQPVEYLPIGYSNAHYYTGKMY